MTREEEFRRFTPERPAGARGPEFTREEREALDAWQVPPPPGDLAHRVLARAGSRRGSRVRWLALAAGLLLALGAAWLLLPRQEQRGSLVATTRTTTRLGSRGVAVAEEGASLRWSGRAGELRVIQSQGNVFYRVDRGAGPFVVETGAGSVRVLGTCFRLEVMEMKSSRAGLAGAAVGATAATLLLVTVYEGKVLTASPRGELEVGAGQVARLRPGEAPERLGQDRGPRHAGGAAVAEADSVYAPSTTEGLVRQNQKLRAEKESLESRLDVLQSQLQQTAGKANRGKILGLNQDELAQLAKRCELRWDMPPLGTSPPRVDSKAAKALGLSQTERDSVKRVFADFHGKLLQDLSRLYVEVTGDAKSAEHLSPGAMMSEIEDKSPKEEIKQVYQRLARERAGLQSAPADLSSTPAVERLFRLLTTAGDRVEQALGGEIGPDLARRYREHRDGFGSRSRSSLGCPGSQ